MKKSTKIFLIILALTLLASMSIGTFIFKNITLSPVMYSNNIYLTLTENEEIKALVLDAVKNRFSYGPAISETLDLDDDAAITAPRNTYDISPVIIIDEDFMKTLEENEHGEYLLTVKMYYPVDYSCYFTVKNTDGEYTITGFGIDP